MTWVKTKISFIQYVYEFIIILLFLKFAIKSIHNSLIVKKLGYKEQKNSLFGAVGARNITRAKTC